MKEPDHVTIPVFRFVCFTLPVILFDLFRFLLAVIAMAPGGVRMAYHYCIASNHVSIQYGASIRQSLDVYPSLLKRQSAPTVLFFYGGAWIIGYKFFGTLLARTLTAAGVTVVIADYRNWPIASVPQQVDDVEAAVQWTRLNVAKFGGDPNKLIVAGESAGGHLMFMALLRRVFGLKKSCDWHPTDLKGFVAMATPVHFRSMESTFQKHRWERSFLEAIFGGEFEQHDPYSLLIHHRCRSGTEILKDKLPPVMISHGDNDQTVPLDGVMAFAKELKCAGANVRFNIYEGWTHLRANVEGPMSGDHAFHRDLFDAVVEWTDSRHLQFPGNGELVLQRVCPERLLQLCTAVMPF